MRYLFISYFVILSTLAESQCEWKELNTPSNGFINCFVKQNNRIFTGTIEGVYYSENKGKTWVYSGLRESFVRFIYPYNNKLFSGTLMHGLFKSNDFGKTWIPIEQFNKANIRTMIHKDRNIIVCTFSTIYISKDEGETWESLYSNTNYNFDVWKMAFKGDTLWAATAKDSLYRSLDYGKNWENIKTLKLLPQNFTSGVQDLYIENDILYFKSKETLYSSSNNGETWQYFSKPMDANIYSFLKRGDLMLLAAGYPNNKVEERIYRSENEGKTWGEVKGLEDAGAVKTLFHDKDFLLVGTFHRGIYKSTNKGKTWKRSTEGIKDRWTRLIFFDDMLGIGSFDASFLSKNDGKTWQDISILKKSYDYSLSGMPYLGLIDDKFYATADKKLYTSPSKKIKWDENIIVTDSNAYVGNFWVNNEGIFVIVDTWAKPESHFIYKSTDKGKSWIKCSEGLNPNNRISNLLGNDSTKLYVASKNFYQSTDLGRSWQKMTTNLTDSITFFYGSEKLFFAAANKKLYKSEDGAITWEQVLKDFNIADITCIAFDTEILALGTIDKGIIISYDKGKTWKNTETALRKSNIMNLTIKNNFLYALTKQGLFKIDKKCLK